jgi:hypothetical protein
MKLTETEQAELKALARMTDDKSLDRFIELLAKEDRMDGTNALRGKVRESITRTYPEYTKALRGKVRESITRAFPEYTEAQIDIFLRGRVRGWDLRESESPDWWPHHIEALAAAVKSLHPSMNDQEVAQWVKTHEERALAAKGKDPVKGDSTIVMHLDSEDTAETESHWLQDGLKKLHPNWSQSQIDEWVKKNETLALSFKGLHPEGNAADAIRAADPKLAGGHGPLGGNG